jgi:4-amino-4-deoxy-L-arabinose transferase-like glycosyltransferase
MEFLLLKKYRLLFFIILLTVIMRLLFVFLTKDRIVVGDEGTYVNTGIKIAENFRNVFLGEEGSKFTLWGKILKTTDENFVSFPLPMLWVVFFNLISSKPLIMLAIVQSFLSIIAVILIYLLGKTIDCEKTGLIATLIFALYPLYNFYCILAMSEYIFMLLLIPFIYCVYKYLETKNLWWSFLAGILWGLGSLARSPLLYCFIIIPCWFLYEERNNWKKHLLASFIILICGLIIIAPWSLRNYYKYDVFVPISTHSSFVLLIGYQFDQEHEKNPSLQHTSILPTIKEDLNEGQKYKKHMKMFDEFVMSHPLKFLAKQPGNFFSFLAPDIEISLRFFSNAFGFKLSRVLDYFYLAVEFLTYGVIFLSALFGLIWSPKSRFKTLSIFFLVFFTIIHTIAIQTGRNHMGIMFFFFIFSGWFFLHLKEAKILFKNKPRISSFTLLLCLMFIIHWLYLVFVVIVIPNG